MKKKASIYKRCLVAILSLATTLTSVPLTALAEESNEIAIEPYAEETETTEEVLAEEVENIGGSVGYGQSI